MDRPISKKALNSQAQKKWLKLSAWLVFIAFVLYFIQWLFSPGVNRDKIRVAAVKVGDISATINASGLVVPLVEETISSEFDTQIVRVIAQLGSALKKGDPILELNAQSVELVIANLDEKLALKDTQIQTKQLQRNKSFNDLESRIELLKIDLQSRMTREKSLKQLSSVGAFSKHELLESKLNVKRTRIELKQLQQSKVDLDSTTSAEVRGLQLEKSILSKERDEQKRLRQLSVVRATRDGTLSWVNNVEGASVGQREPLAKISDNSKFRIEAQLSDFYASQLKSGMSAEIYYNDQTIAGQLGQLSPTIENGVMKILVELIQPTNDLLRNNLRVDVGLVLENIQDAKTLSKGPFISGRGLQKVYVIRDNIAYQTEVRIGLSNANEYQVISGLDVNDQVIISDVSDYLHLKQFAIN
ncbi:MAG: HlyD family efflux transporter periplasmic adaptor subunit [Kangiellaceae bacterium]|nr:HlyD family efflux transporter periplasmic adaptor subunit [Kangiellaceae bacterium]